VEVFEILNVKFDLSAIMDSTCWSRRNQNKRSCIQVLKWC